MRPMIERQRYIKGAAMALAALDPDIAAVPHHELPAQVEPQAEPFAAALAAARVAIEQPRQLLFRDARALILHQDDRQGLVLAWRVGARLAPDGPAVGVGRVERGEPG